MTPPPRCSINVPVQPNPRPTALQALDAGLAAILMVLRALIGGHLHDLLPPGAAAIPLRSAAKGEPSARRECRLECVLIAPARRRTPRPICAHAPGRHGALARPIRIPPQRRPLGFRPLPRCRPPPSPNLGTHKPLVALARLNNYDTRTNSPHRATTPVSSASSVNAAAISARV